MSALFVQADIRGILRGSSRNRSASERERLLCALVDDLAALAKGDDLWMPAYNYGFFRERTFDARKARSEMGVLSEHFRTHHAQWRTAVPILSFSGTGPQPPLDLSTRVLRPNSTEAPIGRLVTGGGRQLLLGCTVQWSSLFHYAEVFDGAFPVYRYEKGFSGTTIDWQGAPHDVEVRYAVTSMNRPAEYDFSRMHAAMLQAGVARPSARYPASFDVDPQDFMLTWQRLSAVDPFWPLTQESRSWIQPMVERLGRGLRIEDFEPPG